MCFTNYLGVAAVTLRHPRDPLTIHCAGTRSDLRHYTTHFENGSRIAALLDQYSWGKEMRLSLDDLRGNHLCQ